VLSKKPLKRCPPNEPNHMPVLTIAPEKFVKALWLQAGVIVAPGTEFSPDAPISAKVPDAEIQTLKELRFWP